MRNARLSAPDRFVGRFARANKGSVAVEFGLVIMPFLFMLFALLELAMALLASSTLETAVQMASRQIRTGEFQNRTQHAQADFGALVCANMSWLSRQCATDSFVDVRTFTNFDTLAANAPQAANNFKANKTCFAPGRATDIVLVRVYFRWRLLTPFLDAAMENMGTGSGLRMMSSATAFQNEPYDDLPALGESDCPSA